MENMIKVINDNLRNVINGIKEHRKDLENKLDEIKNQMALKVNVANSYKNEVETARNTISSIENEICDLETDLNELNEKFGSKDFKEILAAGNKEINSKIIEKRALISEQSRIIMDLTEKARVLKDELIDLKSQKETEEANLEKTKILESYFCSRITDIINYSEDHPNELAKLQVEIPQEELDVEDFNENEDISTIIDGSIFQEIDQIQLSEPDEELIQSVLEHPEELSTSTQEETKAKDSTQKTTDISTTEQLENMITEARAFIEKNKLLHENDNSIEKNVPENEEKKDNKKNDNKKEKKNSKKEETEEKVEEKIEKEISKSEEEVEPVEYIDINVPNEEIIDEESEEKEGWTSSDVINDKTYEELSKELDGEKQNDGTQEKPKVETEEDVIDINVPDIEESHDETEDVIDLKIEDDGLDVVSSIDDLVIREEDFNKEDDDMNTALVECGLDPNMFEEDDLILLSTSFDKKNTEEFIKVLNEYKISINNIYKNVRVLVYVTSQNLKQILDLLIKTDAKNEDLDRAYIFFDKINVSKLEQLVMSGNNLSMNYVLAESIPSSKETVIGDVLGLEKKQLETLKKNASSEDFKIMNTLPSLVKENYDELNRYHVNNPIECITKYPHKFTLTNSVFHQILDKYDVDDLVRCINKNAAVIDKL